MKKLPTKAELLDGELVSIDQLHKKVTANTIKIADYFGKRPSNVNQRIGNLVKQGRLKIKPSYYLNQQGKEQKYHELDRQQFAQVVLGFTGDKAEQFRLEYTREFERKDQENEMWRTQRLSTSESTKVANDSVFWLKTELEKIIPESNRFKMLFVHIQQGINKAATGHAKANRPLLDKDQLEAISTLENTVRSAIERFKAEDMPAEQIRDEVMALIKSGGNHETRKNLPRRQSEAGFQCAAQ